MVAANYTHSLAIKSNGTLWAWGRNTSGQLGNGTNESVNQPIQISPDTNWVKISAGGEFSLAMKSDSSIWGWGSNEFGQIGLPFPSYVYQPTMISTTKDWVNISTGKSNSFFINNNGSLWACGFNLYGELGLGNFENTFSLTQVGIDNDWLTTASGFKHTLGIKTDGKLWAWGVNNGGLGDGTFINRVSPVFISCSTLEINNNENEKYLTIFPNPSSTVINLSENISEVIFYSIDGKYINSKNVNGKYLDISDLQIGIYLLKIKTLEGNWLESKLLKNL
jgi:alpha-tubulin suppressor-like RCC1 family protein